MLHRAPQSPPRWSARLPGLCRPPDTALARVRWFFFLLALANLAMVGPMLVFASQEPVTLRVAAALATACLGWWWARTFTRAQVPWLAVVPEGLALLLITAALGDPVRASGVLYTGLYFRALYGSAPAVGASTLAVSGALVGAELRSRLPAAVLVGPVVTNTIGYVSVALLMHVVARALSGHERSNAREQALRRAGAALVAATDRDSIARAALTAVFDLIQPGAALGSAVWLGAPRAVHLAAASDDAAESTAENWAVVALAEAPRAALVAGQPVVLTPEQTAHISLTSDPRRATAACLLVPLQLQDALRGVIGIWSAQPLARETHESLQVLASEVALALETAALTEDLHRRKGEERFRALIQHTADVIVILGADGAIQYTSPSATPAWGRPAEALAGTTALELVHQDDQGRARRLFAAVRESGGTATAELQIAHADGSWHAYEVAATNLLAQPMVAGIVLNCHDVTERKRLEEQLVHRAFHDPLTNLANRALLTDRLEHALARAGRQGQPVGVLLLDLDDFKVVNDSLGHQAGDLLLQEVAARVHRCLRAGDTAARLGGDEFAVLLETVASSDEALAVAERLSGALRLPVEVNGRELTVGVSIGLALATAASDRADDLLRRADLALYRAKADGKGTYALFDPSLEARALERLELESDLRLALQRGELHLVYQPILTLDDGRIGEVEALLRWQHPRRGLVPPAACIPVAEETGLIVPIGQWVLEEACRQVRAWQDQYPTAPPLVVSVNLSGRQFQHPGLVADVARTLETSGIDPHCLKLEITESVLMCDVESAVATCAALKELGVQLAIDDFGTGYSSLSQLKRFPFDTLKIDRSFVDGLGRDEQDMAIVRSVVLLAKTLRLSVTAEGIETPVQEAELRSLGCERGQGYLFARPQTPAAMSQLLADGDGPIVAHAA